MTATEGTIYRYIVAELLSTPPVGDDPLADGQLDSLAIEQLLAFIEDEYVVEFEDEELRLEYFSSIPVLSRLVDTKRGALEAPLARPDDLR